MNKLVSPRAAVAAPVADNAVQVTIRQERYRLWLTCQFSAFTSYSQRATLQRLFDSAIRSAFPGEDGAVWMNVLRAWTLPANRRAEVMGFLAGVPIVELIIEEVSD